MNPAIVRPSQIALSNLRRRLSESFDSAELNDLCFELGIDFDNLAGSTRDDKTRELVLFFMRRGELPTLILHLTKVRPKHHWEEIIGFSTVSPNPVCRIEPEQNSMTKPPIISNTINIINTSGGSIVGGSVKAGGDFIGRDQTQSTYNLPGPIGVGNDTKRWTQLSDLLIAEKWKEADQETNRIILEIVGRQKIGRIQAKDIDKISCEDVKMIDYFWSTYSNQQFGFNAQHTIWLASGGTPGKFDFDVFVDFGERVGWRVGATWLRFYEDFTFSLNAPKGHLPSLRMPGSENQTSTWQSWRDCFKDFTSLVDRCLS